MPKPVLPYVVNGFSPVLNTCKLISGFDFYPRDVIGNSASTIPS